jgi:hypothetical protein
LTAGAQRAGLTYLVAARIAEFQEKRLLPAMAQRRQDKSQVAFEE